MIKSPALIFGTFLIVFISGVNCFNSLKEVCQIFSIPPKNCTCDLPFTKGDGTPFDVCKVIDHGKNGTLDKYLNISTNATLSHGLPQLLYAGFSVVAVVVSLIGNSLVIAVVLSQRRDMSNFKRIIASLACCDITFAVLQFIMVLPRFWTAEWIYGEWMCKLLQGASTMGANVTAGIILIISIERYFGIVHPLKQGLTKWMLSGMEILNVVAAAVATIPILIFANVKDNPRVCHIGWPHNKGRRDSLIYNWFEVIFYLIVPSIIIISMYIRIIHHLQMSVNRVKRFVDSDSRQQKHKDNMRVTMILMGVLASYVLLTTPSRIAILVLDHLDGGGSSEHYTNINITVYYILSIMHIAYPLHTAVNPIVYCVVDRKWRRDVAHIFCKKRQRSLSTSSVRSWQTSLSNMSTRFSPNHSATKSVSNQSNQIELNNLSARNSRISNTSLQTRFTFIFPDVNERSGVSQGVVTGIDNKQFVGDLEGGS